MIVLRAAQLVIEALLAPLFILAAVAARAWRKSVDVGIGPEPIVSHRFHKKALALHGYSAETYVADVYYITSDFDVRGDRWPFSGNRYTRMVTYARLFVRALFRYRCVYIYFNGGPLGFGTALLWRLEPLLYRLAGVKVVVMPYGSDVQEMSRSPNLPFKHAMSQDYPGQRRRRRKVERKIDLWTGHASHVISGCEWVDYTYHWDSLIPAHFCIDEEEWKPPDEVRSDSAADAGAAFKIVHAPNHRAIKGTQFLVDAVDALRAEGLDVEMIIVERKPHDELKQVLASADLVVDQLILGWYGMFAVEAMALGKPVLCFLRRDLIDLFAIAGLIGKDEIPIVNCGPLDLKDRVRELLRDQGALRARGRTSREYVLRHHSLRAIGEVFDRVNRSIGIAPRREAGGPPEAERGNKS